MKWIISLFSFYLFVSGVSSKIYETGNIGSSHELPKIHEEILKDPEGFSDIQEEEDKVSCKDFEIQRQIDEEKKGKGSFWVELLKCLFILLRA